MRNYGRAGAVSLLALVCACGGAQGAGPLGDGSGGDPSVGTGSAPADGGGGLGSVGSGGSNSTIDLDPSGGSIGAGNAPGLGTNGGYIDLTAEQATDIIYNCDLEGRFTFVNPTATRLMKYSEAELIGRHFLSLIREDFRERAAEFYERQRREYIRSTYFEFPAIAKDGTEIWVGQNVQIVEEHGRTVGVQAIAIRGRSAARTSTAGSQIDARRAAAAGAGSSRPLGKSGGALAAAVSPALRHTGGLAAGSRDRQAGTSKWERSDGRAPRSAAAISTATCDRS